jgi:uncharacterized protein (TIGR01777 family)
MKVLVTGAGGTVGSALMPALTKRGHEAVRLVRRTPRSASEIQWNPNGQPDPKLVDGAAAIVHLAGETIAGGRWSAEKKSAIRDSRVLGTRTIAKSILAAANPPRVLVSGSAIGFYGSRADEVLTEKSAAGSGFLADVCRAWEDEAQAARAAGTRVVMLRTSVVLAPSGGALAKMLPPFRMGLGGKIGSGAQWWSWIALPDLIELILAALTDDKFQGPLNAASPNPVTNLEFTNTLGHVLHRPTIFPLPALAVKIAFGEMGEELLLASQRVQPAASLAAGFQFQHSGLESALKAIL